MVNKTGREVIVISSESKEKFQEQLEDIHKNNRVVDVQFAVATDNNKLVYSAVVFTMQEHCDLCYCEIKVIDGIRLCDSCRQTKRNGGN